MILVAGNGVEKAQGRPDDRNLGFGHDGLRFGLAGVGQVGPRDVDLEMIEDAPAEFAARQSDQCLVEAEIQLFVPTCRRAPVRFVLQSLRRDQRPVQIENDRTNGTKQTGSIHSPNGSPGGADLSQGSNQVSADSGQ